MSDGPEQLVLVVDDDPRVREALQDLLESHGFSVVSFGSVAEYLSFARPSVPSCLLLDIELPDGSGLELQEQIAGEAHPHIVFITGHGDIASSVRACKAGAIDFLTKPFGDKQLLSAVESALEQDRQVNQHRARLAVLFQRFESLSDREREVLPLVVSGLLNKQAAAVLGISEVTLQIHRRNIMSKMHADSLPDLVRMADALGVPITHSRRERR